jgi:hypothetical protein
MVFTLQNRRSHFFLNFNSGKNSCILYTTGTNDTGNTRLNYCTASFSGDTTAAYTYLVMKIKGLYICILSTGDTGLNICTPATGDTGLKSSILSQKGHSYGGTHNCIEKLNKTIFSFLPFTNSKLRESISRPVRCSRPCAKQKEV